LILDFHAASRLIKRWILRLLQAKTLLTLLTEFGQVHAAVSMLKGDKLAPMEAIEEKPEFKSSRSE
jgi:hypothetical protein